MKTNAVVKRYRLAVQASILLLEVFLGFRLWQFARHFETHGAVPLVSHPNGVEGFLPIGGLTSLKYWIATGNIHPYHPAAMVIFIGAIAVSLGLKKGFCGWICPVGFVSNYLYEPWRRLFKKNVMPPRWIDYPLRSLKYLIALFFLWAIVITMGSVDTNNFLNGEYWMVADVKMLDFFFDISALTLEVLILLVVLSVPIRNFWCRYLCPYGAFLGVVSIASPFEITRDTDKCNSCGKCSRDCPQYINVADCKRVTSLECTSCMTCLSGCPKEALSYTTPSGKRQLAARYYPLALLGIFFGIILIAMLTGHWSSNVPYEELQKYVPIAGSLMHP